MPLVIETKPIPLTTNEHGVVLVSGTRVPLDTIVYAFRNGASAEEIVQDFSSLKLADVYAVIGYYLAHQKEVDAYIQQREAEREVVHRRIDARFDQVGFRERLLARQRNKNA